MTPPDAGLARLELLRAFKRKMPRADPAANVGPFEARVSTAAAGGPGAEDLADIHAGVRARVRDAIADVRDGRRQSQVVLLSGAAGVGKTHLLRSFATPEAVGELGHVFVGGSNHWTVGEFQAQLLDWVVEALTLPGPADDHALLERVRAIGFRAVEQMLTSPVTWKTCLARPRGPLARLTRRRTRPSQATLRALCAARDPAVFRHLDDAAFGAYVCDRFLAERANLAHRFALRVLLTYLFPDRPEGGVGTRERVLHWFRGRGDADYFTRRLGASERPDRAYTQFEAVKLLAHLFSPAVSRQLSTDAVACEPRVLLLTFDQAEGRDELFDSEGDWRDFFAHLSELYNSLPNVVVLFTMTLGLRNRLHGVMERQFRDRIRMDDSLTLSLPTPGQVAAIYRARVSHWLRDDPDTRASYADFGNPALPFEPAELTAVADNQSVRDVLEILDREFRQKLAGIAVDVSIDYLYDRNELKAAEAAATEWDYTADHLGTVRRLLEAVGALLGRAVGVELQKHTPIKLDNVPVLHLVFALPQQSHAVNVYLARFGNYYTAHIPSLIQHFLYNREKARNFLTVVRPVALPATLDAVESRYATQFATGVCPVPVESAFRSLFAVEAKRGEYTGPGQVAELDGLIRDEVAGTYLAQLFRHARAKLDDLAAAGATS